MTKKERKERLYEIEVLAVAKAQGMNICNVCLKETQRGESHIHNLDSLKERNHEMHNN